MTTRSLARTCRLAILGALVAIVPACSGGVASSAPSSMAASLSEAASPSVSLTPTATPVPTLPADAAPAQLKGRWTTLMGPGDPVLLIINDTAYSISRGGASNGGHISVTDDQIAFSRVPTCPGTGTYRWAIDANGILTFTPVGDPDPCPRAGLLKGQAYARE